jgi:hypothetical protein
MSSPGVHAGAHSTALIWTGFALLALALSALGVFLLLRSRTRGVSVSPEVPRLPLACPHCGRRYVAGTTFCAADAYRLVAAAEGASAESAPQGGKCPRCRRAYEPGLRFCAIDAEELVPLPVWQATHAEGGLHLDGEEITGTGGAAARVYLHGDGKICPLCATKYDLEALFCGRDGAELVTVN